MSPFVCSHLKINIVFLLPWNEQTAVCAPAALCVRQWSVRLGPRRGQSCVPSSSPSTPQTSSTNQSPAIFRNSLVTLLELDVSEGARRQSAGLWWEILSHGVKKHLQLNVAKMKELVVDLRTAPVSVQKAEVLQHVL